jgi:hypothetical protein
MGPITISVIAFLFALAGIGLGSLARRVLPAEQLGTESKDVIKLSLGIVVSLSALVLGLLVASAKGSYEARRSEINQMTSSVLLLDYLLLKYGDDAKRARVALREEIPLVIDQIWTEQQAFSSHTKQFKPLAQGEAFYQYILDLRPKDDTQIELRGQIAAVVRDLSQLRLLLFSHFDSSIPTPFLAVLLLWIIVLFTGFSLMAPGNAAPFTFLVICALSVSGAVFLILELDQPFAGIMMIPSDVLLNALPPLT